MLSLNMGDATLLLMLSMLMLHGAVATDTAPQLESLLDFNGEAGAALHGLGCNCDGGRKENLRQCSQQCADHHIIRQFYIEERRIPPAG